MRDLDRGLMPLILNQQPTKNKAPSSGTRNLGAARRNRSFALDKMESLFLFYKYLDKYLSIDLRDRLLATYWNSSCEEMWQALLACQELFRETARYVAEMLGYTYPYYAGKVTAYLKKLFEDRIQ